MDANDIPDYHVPGKIPVSDVPFVITAGIGLAIVSMGLAGTVLRALGIPMDADDARAKVIVLAALGAGPAAAYFLGAWLRRRHVSRLVGCGALVVWAITFSFVAFVAGWVGTVLMIVAPVGLLWALERRRRAAEPINHA